MHMTMVTLFFFFLETKKANGYVGNKIKSLTLDNTIRNGPCPGLYPKTIFNHNILIPNITYYIYVYSSNENIIILACTHHTVVQLVYQTIDWSKH